ncbi:hypothetical protein SISSUDRAFT_1117963 [Sistotremastrum suecicum HHB10207 ss-3]|uniref:Uncharacterized protein n=1 Tax=Sistotremastrum suecicum HHB10207 ss-3 TaxID=1314776 RepID=A0A166FTM3_9AGAM|nr:hypothetical protein SISSUDRAFT_1117963 [Sistotremastrum suecicum HHB10207 ss-3]
MFTFGNPVPGVTLSKCNPAKYWSSETLELLVDEVRRHHRTQTCHILAIGCVRGNDIIAGNTDRTWTSAQTIQRLVGTPFEGIPVVVSCLTFLDEGNDVGSCLYAGFERTSNLEALKENSSESNPANTRAKFPSDNAGWQNLPGRRTDEVYLRYPFEKSGPLPPGNTVRALLAARAPPRQMVTTSESRIALVTGFLKTSDGSSSERFAGARLSLQDGQEGRGYCKIKLTARQDLCKESKPKALRWIDAGVMTRSGWGENSRYHK